MQNTSVINIDIKPSSAAAKTTESSSVGTGDEGQVNPFEETFAKELKKSADSEATKAKPQKNKDKASNDEVAVASQQDKQKAEKADDKNGKQLPTEVSEEEPSVSTEQQVTVQSEQEVELGESDKVAAAAKQEQVIPSVHADGAKAAQEDSSPEKNHVQVEAVKTSGKTGQEVDIEPSKIVNEESKKAETIRTTSNSTDKNPSQQVSAEIKPAILQSAQAVVDENDEAAKKTTDKSLIIKQINIAKEAKENTPTPDKSIKGIVTELEQKNMNKKNAQIKTVTHSGVESADENVAAIKSAKTLGDKKETNTLAQALQQKTVTSEQAVTNAQRETMQLDKKLVESVDVNRVVPPKVVDKTTSTAATPLTNIANPITQTTTLSAAPATPVLDIQPALRTEAWDKVMTGRVIWMAREGMQRAELRLNPANLGPVEVRLAVNNEQASVTFIAQNATTRETLEQALPRLREAFQENGLSLANADVSDQTMEHQQDEYQEQGADIIFSNEAEDDEQIDDSLISQSGQSSRLSLYV